MIRRLTSLGVLAVLGCGFEPVPAPEFALRVIPDEIGDTIPGERCVLLVAVDDGPDASAEPVTISATADGATVHVENAAIRSGEMAEASVFVLPRFVGDESGPGEPRSCSVTIRGERQGATREVTVPITITSEEDDLVAPSAREVRDLFLPWLQEHRPELGIDENTTWKGTIVVPHILVVTHYLYFSDEWEMHVFWHVMIPPYDWARIELRRRFEEESASLAFEIPSRSAEEPRIVSVEPEDRLWR